METDAEEVTAIQPLTDIEDRVIVSNLIERMALRKAQRLVSHTSQSSGFQKLKFELAELYCNT
ncbi:MAG: hypothetical protein V7K90_29865 [Nostoc sp.]|uniref:hypothetical protein n=1 Tax=Nostoc sp. TaxID=1180 RepID=UPI002FFD1653